MNGVQYYQSERSMNMERTYKVTAKENVCLYYQKGDARTDFGSLERVIKFENLRRRICTHKFVTCEYDSINVESIQMLAVTSLL
jgi:hypothetical protein